MRAIQARSLLMACRTSWVVPLKSRNAQSSIRLPSCPNAGSWNVHSPGSTNAAGSGKTANANSEPASIWSCSPSSSYSSKDYDQALRRDLLLYCFLVLRLCSYHWRGEVRGSSSQRRGVNRFKRARHVDRPIASRYAHPAPCSSLETGRINVAP